MCHITLQDNLPKSSSWVIRNDDKLGEQQFKNTNCRKLNPSHRKLLELVFIEYVNSVQQECRFSVLKYENEGYGTAASKCFVRLQAKVGFGWDHDFHSFRHTVATKQNNASISAVIASELLGHMQNNTAYDRYGKQVGINVLNHAINILRIESTTTSKFTL